MSFLTRKFEIISTIDVDTAYAYKNKGIIRTFGGFLKDLVQFEFVNFWYRLLTILN